MCATSQYKSCCLLLDLQASRFLGRPKLASFKVAAQLDFAGNLNNEIA